MKYIYFFFVFSSRLGLSPRAAHRTQFVVNSFYLFILHLKRTNGKKLQRKKRRRRRRRAKERKTKKKTNQLARRSGNIYIFAVTNRGDT